MKTIDIIRYRLYNQHFLNTQGKSPAEIVSSLGAVQAQDYLGGLWAVGLRAQNACEKDVEQALADKTIVRTWPMRGTLHFIAAGDIRWMLKLLTPRIMDRASSRNRELELDATVFLSSRKLLEKKLQGGGSLTRDAAYKVLADGGISPEGQRGIHILGQLAQEGLLCFGKREGKQQTFVLLDEWIPKSKILTRDESLAELAKRYFTGHGPASVQDFAWWSGLNLTEARKGLEIVKSNFKSEEIEGNTYWFPLSAAYPKSISKDIYLLPTYDEYLVGYKDRSAIFDPEHLGKLGARANILFHPTFIIEGHVAGTWGRILKKDKAEISLRTFVKLSKTQNTALHKAAEKYGKFLGLPNTKITMQEL